MMKILIVAMRKGHSHINLSCTLSFFYYIFFSFHCEIDNVNVMITLCVFGAIQVIALNSTGEAEGELYIDDGKSFEFLKGAYIHRHFTFSDGKLTSSAVASTSGSRYLTDCTVERIILLGLSSGPKSALVEPVNQKVEIELGPLRIGAGKSPSALTIRKPNVRIGDDWTIKIL